MSEEHDFFDALMIKEIDTLRAELERVRHGGYSDWHTGYSVGR